VSDSFIGQGKRQALNHPAATWSLCDGSGSQIRSLPAFNQRYTHFRLGPLVTAWAGRSPRRSTIGKSLHLFFPARLASRFLPAEVDATAVIKTLGSAKCERGKSCFIVVHQLHTLNSWTFLSPFSDCPSDCAWYLSSLGITCSIFNSNSEIKKAPITPASSGSFDIASGGESYAINSLPP